MHAIGRFKRSDFGFKSIFGPVGDDVILEMGVEFVKPNAPAPPAPSPDKEPPESDLRGFCFSAV